MSVESAKAFVERMKSDQAFAAKVRGFKSFEEVQEFAKNAGFDFLTEELNQVAIPLDDNELESIAGGGLEEQCLWTAVAYGGVDNWKNCNHAQGLHQGS